MKEGATEAKIIVYCPIKGEVELSYCMKCVNNKGLVGEWPHKKVKCRMSVLPVKTEVMVACPLRKKYVKFKPCLTCPLHRGFYGFHDDKPVIFCGLLAESYDYRIEAPLYAVMSVR